MTKRLNMRSVFSVLVTLIVVAALSSCSKELMHPNELGPDQLTSGRLDGTWTNPSDIVTPANVPAEVFGSMRLVFTTDGSGNPSKFLAQDCPIIFGNVTSGKWTAAAAGDSTSVKLTGAGPVDDFKVKVTSKKMTLSFFMGWENTDTKATGKGNFRVTLNRQ